MLIYLDTAQLAWLEGASESEQSEFVTTWQKFGCELAVSLQILQEIQKRGSPDNVSARLGTLQQLQPLRGIPAASAGVMMLEITEQIRQRVAGVSDDYLSRCRRHLFPPLSKATLCAAIAQHSIELVRFNMIGQAQAILQGDARVLTPLRKGMRVDPVDLAEFIRGIRKQVLEGLSANQATEVFRVSGDRAINAIHDAEGDLWEANLRRLGISELACLKQLHPEDFSKAAGFVEMARSFAADVATGAGTNPSTVLALVNELRPNDAPGYSLEMAVARARTRHSRGPTAADQVDEEHVSFAPYVDLMFVDKRTKAYIEEEVRRHDGRVAYDPSAKLVRPRNLSDVLEAISNIGLTTDEG